MDNKDLIIENLKLKIQILEQKLGEKKETKKKTHTKNIENIQRFEEYQELIVDCIDFLVEEAKKNGLKTRLTSRQVSDEIKSVSGIEIKSHTCGKIMTHLYSNVKKNINGTNFYVFVG